MSKKNKKKEKGIKISKSERRDAEANKLERKKAKAEEKAEAKPKGGKKAKKKAKGKSMIPSPGADIEREALANEDATLDESGEALTEEFFQARKEELASRVSAKRLRHIEGVVGAAESLAEIYGVDKRKARLAGLLHDWDKGYDDEGIRARAKEVGLDVPALYLEEMPQTLHGMTASLALGREFPTIPQDVLQAVYRHTSCAVGMSPLDMVIYIADCIEPGRKIDTIDELREAVGKVPLEELFFRTHGIWTTIVIRRNATMLPVTVDVWNYYALRHRARRNAEREAAGLPPRTIDVNNVQGA